MVNTGSNMSADSDLVLPHEIILSIIEYVVTPADAQRIALPASHLVIKTLLSLAHVSSLTYPIARRLLYTHGLYIDTAERLTSITTSLADANARQHNLDLPRSMNDGDGVGSHISSLYLSYKGVNKPHIAQLVSSLFTAIAPHLRRLIIDMDLRYYDQEKEQDRIARTTLRNSFSQLTALESFCSVRDECFLPVIDPDSISAQLSVWSLWPKLKTLALYNQDIELDDFWEEIGKRKQLDTLVLTRPDGAHVNLLHEWETHLHKGPFEVIYVDVDGGMEDLNRISWKEREVRVTFLTVPISYYGDEDEIVLCQEWVKRRALRGIKPSNWDSMDWQLRH